MKRLLKKRVFICVVACLLASSQAAGARTIRVAQDGTADYQSIKPAVAAAQNGDVIVIAPGVYVGPDNRNIVAQGKSMTIRSTDPNDPTVVDETIIDCQGSAAEQACAFKIRPDGLVGVTLAGLTILRGRASVSGGVVQCEDGRARIVNCVFADSVAAWSGGAIHAANSNLTCEGCTFVANRSEEMYGGAIACRESQVTLTRCTFEDNVGGAIRSFDSILTLSDCTFENNLGRDGGAIQSHMGANVGVPARLDMRRCMFVGNVAEMSGGAVHNYNAEAMFDGCTFVENSAGEDGGAVYNYRSSPIVTSCLFVRNTATALGGALMNWYNSSPTVINCTFIANEATSGGAIACRRDSNPLISHSILWSNLAAQGNNVYLGLYEWDTVYTTRTAVERSDIAGGQDSTFAEFGCVVTWGAGNMDIDPLFARPDRDDYRLSADSPCIDAGDRNLVPSVDATDVEGNARRLGSSVDLGAYEFQGLAPVYRFWSPIWSKHFYTVSRTERDKLLYKYPEIWRLEDTAYYAFLIPVSDKLVGVYRFWSPSQRAHFWTISVQEKQAMLRDFNDVWTYEGVVFYAYPEGQQPPGTMPVYRFWSDKLGHHFYTLQENEKSKLIRDYARTWTFEGIAFYTYARPIESKETVYVFTGGPQEARFTVSLKAYIDGKEAQIDQPDMECAAVSTSMKMAVDFDSLVATLNELHVETASTQHTATIRQSLAGGVIVPFTLSVRASFDALTPRGPFDIEPATLVFANFTEGGRDFSGANEHFRWTGSVTFDRQPIAFSQTTGAHQLRLESHGSFEGLRMLPAGVSARMPYTFQWQRQNARDLLAEATVNGHLVQLYVVSAQVSTQGFWHGRATK